MRFLFSCHYNGMDLGEGMKKHVRLKSLRSNDLERYLNESSFCYANIGFVDKEAKRGTPSVSSLLARKLALDHEKEEELGDILISEPVLFMLSAETESASSEGSKRSDFISQNADILKNSQFLRGFRKTFHRDKLVMAFSVL